MEFEISVYEANRGKTLPNNMITVQAKNWFLALQRSLAKLDRSLEMQNLNFSMMEDGKSAEVLDPKSGHFFKINAVFEVESLQLPIAGSGTFSSAPLVATPPFEIDTRVIEAVLEPTKEQQGQRKKRSNLSTDIGMLSIAGHYSPGETEDVLASIFMKVANLYENYGNDRKAALSFVLSMLFKNIKAVGGGLLLTDLMKSDPILWFEIVMGLRAEELAEIRIPLERGVIGHSASHRERLNIEDIQTEKRFPDDVFRELGLPIGPCLCVPLEYGAELEGVLVLYKGVGDTPFTEGEFSIFTYLSETLAEYLHLSSPQLASR